MSISANQYNNIPGSIISENIEKYKNSIDSKCIFPKYHKTEYPALVYDQAKTSMCIPCSIALMKHIQVYKKTKQSIIFNPIFLYANRNKSLYNDLEGMSTKDCLKILQSKGISTTNDITCFNYNDCIKKYQLYKQEWDLEAIHYKIDNFYLIESEKDIKYAIYMNGSVTAMIPKYVSLLFPTKPDGTSYIRFNKSDKLLKGYHQITIIGWYENYWIIQNSWGIQYGANGIVYIPMDYPLEEVWYFD